MNILVTGGLGYIGSRVVQYFLDKGHIVTILDNLESAISLDIEDASIINIDMTDEEATDKLDLDEKEVVIHMAGPSSGMASAADPVGTISRGYATTLNTLKLAKRLGVRRFLFASSMVVYGNVSITDCPVKENSACEPVSHYGIGKQANERLIEVFCSENDIGYNCLRMFNVYGPGQDLNRLDQGLVSIFTALLMKSPQLEVKGSLDRYRDLINIDDVVISFYRAALQSSYDGPINVATGQKTTLKELIDIIGDALNLTDKLELLQGPETPGDIFGIYGDRTLLRDVTGVTTFVDPKEGVKIFVEWAKGEVNKNV